MTDTITNIFPDHPVCVRLKNGLLESITVGRHTIYRRDTGLDGPVLEEALDTMVHESLSGMAAVERGEHQELIHTFRHREEAARLKA